MKIYLFMLLRKEKGRKEGRDERKEGNKKRKGRKKKIFIKIFIRPVLAKGMVKQASSYTFFLEQ